MIAGAHKVSTRLRSSVGQVTVMMSYVAGELLSSRNEPLTEDAACAQEAAERVILGNVIPGLSHDVHSELKLSAHKVILDILRGIKDQTRSAFDVMNQMMPIVENMMTVRTGGKSRVGIPSLVETKRTLQKDLVAGHAVHRQSLSGREGRLTVGAWMQDMARCQVCLGRTECPMLFNCVLIGLLCAISVVVNSSCLDFSWSA